jgi:hypothetical protein
MTVTRRVRSRVTSSTARDPRRHTATYWCENGSHTYNTTRATRLSPEDPSATPRTEFTGISSIRPKCPVLFGTSATLNPRSLHSVRGIGAEQRTVTLTQAAFRTRLDIEEKNPPRFDGCRDAGSYPRCLPSHRTFGQSWPASTSSAGSSTLLHVYPHTPRVTASPPSLGCDSK